MKTSTKVLVKRFGVAVLASFLTSNLVFDSHAQGEFLATNGSAPTRVGIINGPLAGQAYLGQFLAGATVDSLAPVGAPIEHREGRVLASAGIVPGLACGTIAQMQMVAWDSTVWGTSLQDVPVNQLGRTDVVPVNLSCSPVPLVGPVFRQPAIVPPVPEPSTSLLLMLGAFWMLRLRIGRRGR